ncbi:MAG: hypothetical protein SH819_09620 [Cytophagales bacterium]|nr:hypothetical protein [Cytophagales bacterium]
MTNTISSFITIVPLLYIIVVPPRNQSDLNTFWYIWGGSLATFLILQVAAHSTLGKAIERYNLMIYQPTGQSIGGSVSVKF